MGASKYCGRCKQNVPVEGFSKSSTSKDGLQGYCKECSREYQSEYYDKNKTKRQKYHQTRRRKTKRSKTMKAWHEKNPEVNRVYRARQRARAFEKERGLPEGALGEYTQDEWIAICEEYAYSCLACFKSRPIIEVVADHVVPLEKGGRNVVDNLQPLCRSCNAAKQDRIIDYRPKWRQLVAEGKIDLKRELIVIEMGLARQLPDSYRWRHPDDRLNSLRLSRDMINRRMKEGAASLIRVTIEIIDEDAMDPDVEDPDVDLDVGPDTEEADGFA